MKLRCLHDGFLFVWLQRRTKEGHFVEHTDWGFEFAEVKDGNRAGYNSLQRTLNEGHWAVVLTVGPKCEEVKQGDYVIIEPMMHSNAFEYDGVQIYKSDETKVLIVSKEKQDTHIKQ